jgi:hypothetical protein
MSEPWRIRALGARVRLCVKMLAEQHDVRR